MPTRNMTTCRKHIAGNVLQAALFSTNAANNDLVVRCTTVQQKAYAVPHASDMTYSVNSIDADDVRDDGYTYDV